MAEPVTVGASFAVQGSTYRDVHLDIDGTKYVQDGAGGWKVYVPDAEPTPAEKLSRVAADLQRFKLEADAALAALDRDLAKALAAIKPASPSDTEADDMIRRGRDA